MISDGLHDICIGLAILGLANSHCENNEMVSLINFS